jgi:CO dehydrogenase nickel-insertion accessory protein CooC1
LLAVDGDPNPNLALSLGHDAQMDGCPPAQQAASPLALAVWM